MAQDLLVSNYHSQQCETPFAVMFRLLSLFIRQFRYFGGLVKHTPSVVALEGV